MDLDHALLRHPHLPRHDCLHEDLPQVISHSHLILPLLALFASRLAVRRMGCRQLTGTVTDWRSGKQAEWRFGVYVQLVYMCAERERDRERQRERERGVFI